MLAGGLGVIVGLVFVLFVGHFPAGVALTVPLGALVLMWAGRFAARAVSLVRPDSSPARHGGSQQGYRRRPGRAKPRSYQAV